MSNTLATFEEGVKRRLKDVCADLIPEERWDAIVHATVQEFERIDLPKLIKAELTEEYRKAIAEEFAKPGWQANWGCAGMEASDAVKRLLIEAAPAVLASMFGGAMQGLVQQFQYALSQSRGY